MHGRLLFQQNKRDNWRTLLLDTDKMRSWTNNKSKWSHEVQYPHTFAGLVM